MKSILVALIAVVMLTMSGNSKAEQEVIAPGGFVHSVYFWLNNPENQEDRDAFLHHLTTFIDNSDYVKTKHIGVVAPSGRGVVDSSYDYTLVVTFEDKAAQDAYQVEPVHIKFVEDAQHLWSKVVVYDSTSILKD
ncbi:Dabb family protein [Glaciecola sp. 1036]|uniref:Dabb family protein n=1 Tax=Alteromonadaceae TaxID=72275 RepID=UPI003D085649